MVSAFERIVNGLVEASRAGLIGSGVAQPVGTPDSVRKDLERVRDDGGLSDAQLDLLVALSRTRNELQHDLPALTRALNAWFTRHDVGV